jgi:hypothetical protein
MKFIVVNDIIRLRANQMQLIIYFSPTIKGIFRIMCDIR